MKIAIIGCGYAGLSVALSIKNHEVTIFERSEKLLPVGAGVLLQPLGLQILKEFGLESKALNLGNKISSLEGVNCKDRKVLNLHYNDSTFGIGVHRGHLFKELVKCIDSNIVNLKLNENVTDIKVHGKKTDVISNETCYDNFDVVIMSNGAKSTFRKKLSGYLYEKEYPWGLFGGYTKIIITMIKYYIKNITEQKNY